MERSLDPYKDFVETFEPHSTNAQIFFEIDDQKMTFGQALRVLASVGLETLHRRIIRRGDRAWALILISSNDMREATLRLSEAGFRHVMGINPKPVKANPKSGKERYEGE
jgi:hypothetical protein